MQLNIILIKIYNSFVKLGVSLKKIGSDYGGSKLPKLVSVRLLMFVDLTRFPLSIKIIYTHTNIVVVLNSTECLCNHKSTLLLLTQF